MVIRRHRRSANDEEVVSGSDALDTSHEASASHALALQVARFLSRRYRDELEVVDQNLELTRFFLTFERYRLQIRKERTQFCIFGRHHKTTIFDGRKSCILFCSGSFEQTLARCVVVAVPFDESCSAYRFFVFIDIEEI